jgi:hypothetical protein
LIDVERVDYVRVPVTDIEYEFAGLTRRYAPSADGTSPDEQG